MGLIVSNIEASKHEGYLEGTDQEIALIAVSGAMAIAADGDVSSGEFVEANTNFYVKGALGTKAAHFNGDVEVEGGLTLTGESADLGIEGNVVIEGSLTVTGAAEFQGVAEMQSSLYVTGGLYVSGNIADQADDHAATKGYVDSVAQSGFDVAAGENATGGPFTISGNDTLAISGSDDQIAIVLAEDSIQIKLNDDVTLVGDLNAVSGSFSGNISAVDATLTGDLFAENAAFNSLEVYGATQLALTDISILPSGFGETGMFVQFAEDGLYVTGGLYIDGDIASQTDDHAATKGYVDSVAQSGFDVAAGENATGGPFTISGNDTLAISGSDDQIAIVLAEDSIQIKLNDSVTIPGTLSAGTGSFGDALTVGGALQVDGNTTLGDAGSDTLTVNAIADFKAAAEFEAAVNMEAGLTVTGSVTLSGAGSNLTVGGDTTIAGSLTVQGTTTTLDTENLLVEDRFILLARTGSLANNDGGIIIHSGSSDGSDLVFGRYDSDTWAVAKIDSLGGEIVSMTSGDLVNFRAAKLQVSGAEDYIALSGSDLHVHADQSLLLCAGSNESLIVLQNDAEWLKFDMQADAILPAVDNALDLGSMQQRFRNVFTGDLHLQNDRGHWTLIEEETFITFRDNKTGRRFKILMEDITDSGTYGPGNDGKM